MTHAAIEEAVSKLTEEIQTFLLVIGQEVYTITLINGLRWQVKMTPESLMTLQNHKYTVAHRRYTKRRNQNQPTEKEEQCDKEYMSKEEREIYELRQLMGEGEVNNTSKQAICRDHFNTYEYQPQSRKLDETNTKINVWLEHPNTKYLRDVRVRCVHGIRCQGTRSLHSSKVCTALHPFEWDMFPDAYIRYITSLPVEPLENINETILPK